MSAKSISTRLKRLTFNEGEIITAPGPYPPALPPAKVACGPGTEYCMEATLDQIAEVFFRVKDAEFAGGSITYGDVTLTAPTAKPEQRVFQKTENEDLLCRGFFNSEGGAISQEYLKGSYSAGPIGQFSDIGDDERALWLPGYSFFNSYMEGPGVFGGFSNHLVLAAGTYGNPYKLKQAKWETGGVTAFSFWSVASDSTSEGYWFTTGGDNYHDHGSVIFTGNIGVVKLNPEDSTYAKTNRYFIQVYVDLFLGHSDFGAGGGNGAYSIRHSSATPHVCDYVIQLADSSIRCEIYAFTYLSSSGTDIIHKATEWWPYCKDSPETPVWDSETGEKL